MVVKKAVKKVAKKVTKTKPAVKPVVKEPKYTLEVVINDVAHSIKTDDIKKSLLELKPTVLKTRFKITVSNGDKRFDKIMMVRLARLLFNNNLTMDTFVHRVTQYLQ